MCSVGNVLHPVTPRDDPAGVAQVIAESELWTLIHVVMVLGVILMFVALVWRSSDDADGKIMAEFYDFHAQSHAALDADPMVGMDSLIASEEREHQIRAARFGRRRMFRLSARRFHPRHDPVSATGPM